MSDVLATNLSNEKIQQLLMAVGSEPMEDTTQIKATEYNWNEPHCFTREQLHMLDEFTKKTSKKIARKFATLCPGDFEVTIDSITQYFADELLDQALDSKQDEYYLAFGTDEDHPCGVIGIPIQTAFIWATQLLGGAESEEDSRRDLSLLEESLLLDVASAIVEALSESHSSCDFRPGKNVVRRLLPLELEGTEELCKIGFSVEKTDSEKTEAYILVICESLEPIVGKTTQDVGGVSAQDISKAILSRLQQVSISVTAQLASTVLTLGEIMDLKVDDILLLDKEVNEPIEVIVNDQAAFRGRPAKSAGTYAVVITERVCDTT